MAQHGVPLLGHLRPVAALQEVEPLEGSGRMASSLEQTAARSPTSPSSTAATLGRLHPVYGGVDPAEPGELAAGLLPGPGRGPTHRAFSRAESSQEAAVSELREALPCSPRCSSSAGSPWMERLVFAYFRICVFVYLCICDVW